MSECIFCLIAQKKIPAKIVYEDDEIVAFNDIEPKAPVHIIIIPKKHISSLLDTNDDDIDIINKIFIVAKKLACEYGISKNGFRIVNNCGKDGGQSVLHMHFHLLGGRTLNWPPG